MKQLKPILLTGCTASGKSIVAKELATLKPSLIINADALQVYKCWRILSARPNEQDMHEFNHALYGHIDCDKNYNVAIWLEELKAQLMYAQARGLQSILVGGTGLYFTLLTEGLSEIPRISTSTREKSNEFRDKNPQRLLSDLKKMDFQTFSTIDQSNLSRVQRAWEVLHETGKGMTFWQKNILPPILPISEVIPLVLKCEKSTLNENIQNRFKKMVKFGVIDEVEDAFKKVKGPVKIKTAFKAIGAKEIKDYIDKNINFDVLEQSIVFKTRQYAKRQRTWFRNKFSSWIDIEISRGQSYKKLMQIIDQNQQM